MSDDWEFYSLLVDDKPASIYLDLGLADEAPIRSQPDLAYIRVVMQRPRSDGLSSQEEFDDLIAVEDALTNHLREVENITYVGRNTSGGNRDFYFYTGEPAGFSTWANAALARHRHYQFDIGGRPDPNWDTYLGFLYPSLDDLQRIRNRHVLEELANNGDQIARPRTIDHVALLPSATANENLNRYLRGLGFAIDEPTTYGGSIVARFRRQDRPQAIDEIVLPIAQRVRELGGEYDGWGCEVVAC